MSRSASPNSSTSAFAYNSNGYLPFKNLAMQRLSKLLIDGSISARDFRFEVLRYLIYPKTLTHYPIHQQGWLAVLDKHTLHKMGESGQIKHLHDTIKRLEADISLPPYERVGKIVAAIKEATGKQFIRNGAFRQLMNAKFNEYTLSDHLDEINGIDDALRIMREAAAPSKPMKMISTFPELFAASSIRSMLENRIGDNFIFGGATDSTLPAALTTILRGLHPERLRTGAVKRAFDDLMLRLVDKDSPTYEALLKVSNSLPAAKIGPDTEKLAQYLQFSFDNQLGVEGIFAKPGFLEAAEMLLSDERVTNHSFRDWLVRHTNAQYDTPRRGLFGAVPVDQTAELLGTASNLMSAIKDVPVQHANSYDSFLLSLSDTYDGKKEKSRHPFVWAMDALLAVDDTQPKLAFQRACAKVLHGVPVSLYPTEQKLVPVTKSLYDKVESATFDRFSLFNLENGEKKPCMAGGTFIYGAPVIGHFPTYRKMYEPNPKTSLDDDLQISTEYTAPEPLLLNEQRMIPSTMTYELQRMREIAFGVNPMTIPANYEPRPLRLNAGRFGDSGSNKRWLIEPRSKVDADDATTTLGVAFNIATSHTSLHALFKDATHNSVLHAPNKIASLVAAACRNGASAKARDDLGNSLIHDVLAKGKHLPVAAVVEAVTALVMHGGHFADKNHFGVALTEMIPDGAHDKLMPIALASVTEHEVSSALDDALQHPADDDRIAPELQEGANREPLAHRNNVGMAL